MNTSVPYAIQPKQSRWGIASFVFSLLTNFSLCSLFGLGIALQQGGLPQNSVLATVLGWAVIVAFFANLVAIAFGIIGIIEKNTKKTFSILGIALSLLMFLLVCGLFCLLAVFALSAFQPMLVK